jgi:pyruvate dehydrogenase E1 component
MYRFRKGGGSARRIQLLGSGAIMGEALKAAQRLEHEYGVAADVWSVTSYVELSREGAARERDWRHGTVDQQDCWFTAQLRATAGPVIAATDYVRALPELVRAYVPESRRYITLGTDGFGRSDSRAELRRYFEVDSESIVQASLRALQEIEAAQEIEEKKKMEAVISLASI